MGEMVVMAGKVVREESVISAVLEPIAALVRLAVSLSGVAEDSEVLGMQEMAEMAEISAQRLVMRIPKIVKLLTMAWTISLI